MSRWSPAAGQPPAERESWPDPAVVLGASGPGRTATDEDDPTPVARRIRGFGHVVWTDRETGEVGAVGQLGEPIEHEPVLPVGAFRVAPPPLLWDGDQA